MKTKRAFVFACVVKLALVAGLLALGWWLLVTLKSAAALPEASLEEIKKLQSQCVVDKLLASQRKISKSLIIRLNFECDIEAAAVKASDASDARANA